MYALRIAILGLGLLAASAAGTERAYVKTRAGERPRPAVAIDNVCAWPNLTVLRDGTIIATIFNQPCHGLWEGDVECWGSSGGGRTWTLRGTPAPHEPGTNRMNVAAGLAANGDQAVIEEPALVHLGGGRWLAAARYNGLDLYTSGDDAATWNRGQALTGAQQHPGHFTRLGDGRILLSYGNRVDPKGVDVRLSSDQGQTWSEPLRVADFEGDGGYPSSVQLPGGEVLTAYHASPTAYHANYHMGVVLWDPLK